MEIKLHQLELLEASGKTGNQPAIGIQPNQKPRGFLGRIEVL